MAEAEREPLTFEQLRAVNVERCRASFGDALDDRGWTPPEWACALAGEVGEACNLIKKMRRGEPVPVQAVAHELADCVVYLDLLAAKLGIDLGAAVVEKFNIVSVRVGSGITLKG